MSEARYVYGQRAFSIAEIALIGLAHGQTLVGYYPPSRWGKDDGEPGNRIMPDAENAYRQSYMAGLKNSYKGDVSATHPIPKL